MKPAITAGIAYFASVFAVGFALGVIRAGLMQANADEASRMIAVMVELPVMLLVSWFICGKLIRRFNVAPVVAPRAAMGTVALVLLLLAELAVGTLLMGRTFAAHVLTYGEPSYALGLAAQFCFAAFPVVRLAATTEN